MDPQKVDYLRIEDLRISFSVCFDCQCSTVVRVRVDPAHIITYTIP